GETLAVPTTPEVDWPRVAGAGALLAGLGALAAWQGRRRLRRLQEELTQAERRLRQARSRSGDPQQVGPYRVLRRLGKGGMATVYAVEDDFGDRYALKLPDEMSPRFAREYEVLRGLRHPGVVRLYDFSPGAEDEPAYLVMELVQGPTLARVLEERGRLGLDEARSVARSLLEVLAYTHGQGVIHRDLKPANIFLVGPGKVKVVDFGLSRAQGLAALTRTDDTLGTPLYMAPEQMGGKEFTAATDIYAVGLILYEMLAGRRPWLEDNTYRLLAARRAGPPEDPAGLNPALPGELSRLILRMLDPDPDRRPSAREALEELG
ncbi:MAG TPA: serine/threonine-protein kinase, partial [Candidatus Nitrosotenuis sp.]|nr:serine/threonine-protein kinase [Candidatus Nitrosotenuis sp.]